MENCDSQFKRNTEKSESIQKEKNKLIKELKATSILE